MPIAVMIFLLPRWQASCRGGQVPHSGFSLAAAGWPVRGDLAYSVNPNIEGLDVNSFSILDLRRVRIKIRPYSLHPG